jgi:hypothetical protein
MCTRRSVWRRSRRRRPWPLRRRRRTRGPASMSSSREPKWSRWGHVPRCAAIRYNGHLLLRLQLKHTAFKRKRWAPRAGPPAGGERRVAAARANGAGFPEQGPAARKPRPQPPGRRVHALPRGAAAVDRDPGAAGQVRATAMGPRAASTCAPAERGAAGCSLLELEPAYCVWMVTAAACVRSPPWSLRTHEPRSLSRHNLHPACHAPSLELRSDAAFLPMHPLILPPPPLRARIAAWRHITAPPSWTWSSRCTSASSAPTTSPRPTSTSGWRWPSPRSTPRPRGPSARSSLRSWRPRVSDRGLGARGSARWLGCDDGVRLRGGHKDEAWVSKA